MKKIVLLIASITVFVQSYSAIIYTDVNPDFSTTLNYNIGFASNLISIDFNGDGSKEYDVRWDAMFGWFMHLQHSGNNEMILTGNQNSYGAAYIKVINLNEEIGSSLSSGGSWGNSTPEPLFGDNQNGNFQNSNDKFVGVKFFIGTNTHYGWIRVNFSDETLIIYDYAYNDVPNASILAGQTMDNSGGDVLITSIDVFGENGSELVGVNQDLQMHTTILPLDATNQNINWSVQNGSGSATISASGMLTGQSTGTVTVLASSTDNSNISGSKVITVNTNQINITSIAVFGEFGTSTVEVNQTLQIIASISPFDATIFDVNWSITNITGVGSINNSGILTGVSAGTVSVKATATDGTNISDSTIITITGQSQNIQITSINVYGQNGATSVNEGQSVQMEASILPQNATNQNLIWSVTNGTGSATINSNGNLTGQTVGEVTVKASATDFSNVFGETVMTITPSSINVSSIDVLAYLGITDIFINETLQLNAIIQPNNASNLSVSWSIVNGTGSATINSNGLLTPTSIGTVMAYATANDGTNIYDSLQITIKPILANSIIVTSNSGTEVAETQSIQLFATVSPNNTTNQNVNWSVVNGSGSASINATGLLTGQSVGTVEAIATTTDGSNISDTLEVNVTEYIIYVNSIEVNGENNQNTIPVNQYLQMNATVLPTNATNLNYDWSVINGTGSATINESGLLSPTSIGDVTVKAVAQDGSNVSGEKVITITEVVGIDESLALASTVFPNPTVGSVWIESSKKIKTISILTLGSQLVKRKEFSNRINISNLNSGIYIIELLFTDFSKEHHQLIKN